MIARSKRRQPKKIPGRYKIFLSLVIVVIAFLIANWRRNVGVARGLDIDTLTVERATLLSLRSSLKRELSVAMSRDRIVLGAQQRLGLHVANESQTRFIADSTFPVLAGTDR